MTIKIMLFGVFFVPRENNPDGEIRNKKMISDVIFGGKIKNQCFISGL